ncbi:hypothetical protein SAZ10_00685 [Mesorhizobium sp. BAC0120]|uniref:hypothetical protein n=1 Tax=Mesorhizobium sp. BAC0120 TaxID=3090670 RepID=UPI00298BD31D|nr:hypothetical protein [Mesorhizobium sp. BAC0120]MDW6020272.1 hypothetical protein [Mesorhizobium sp. BAC0120]
MTEYERFRLTELVRRMFVAARDWDAFRSLTLSKAVAAVMPDCPVGPELEGLIEEIALKDGRSLLLDAHQ